MVEQTGDMIYYTNLKMLSDIYESCSESTVVIIINIILVNFF